MADLYRRAGVQEPSLPRYNDGMHELPITEGILKISTEAAGGRQITTIHLVVGELSSIVDDSIQFYFDMLSKGTVAEGAVAGFSAPARHDRVSRLRAQLEVRARRSPRFAPTAAGRN